MCKENLTLLLSAVGGMPSKGVIDVLRGHEVEVVGVDADPFSFGLQYADSSYVVPRGDDPDFVEELLRIVRKEGVDGLLLSPESEVIAVAEQRERFEAEGCTPMCPSFPSVKQCFDKKKTSEGFEELNIPTPTLYDSMETVEYPCIVKPQFGRGSTGVYLANNKEELSVYTAKMERPLVQRYVPGKEYTVDVLTGQDGNVVSVIPRERIGVQSGKSVTGMTVDSEEIREYCRSIASSWQLFGPSCIQCIQNNDQLYFIEVNTRFGGGAVLSMFADMELIPNLLRLIRGDDVVESDSYDVGLVMLRNYEQMFVDQTEIHGQQ